MKEQIEINIANSNLGYYHIPVTCNRDVCIDIGANVGDFTNIAKNEFELVHFYEPYKPCFDKICMRFKDNTNVIGYNEGVYKLCNEQICLISHKNMDSGSLALNTDVLNDHWDSELLTDVVTTVSLPSIVKRAGGRINYMKCDCECAEYYLFLGQDLTCIDYIGIELHWQIGLDRWNELIDYICNTHYTEQCVVWAEDCNREVLFTKK